MLPSLGVRRIYLRACPNDFRASPSIAGLPHHAGLVSGFCSSSPSLWHRLPSDSASRRTPLPSLAVPVITARRGLTPPGSKTCLARKKEREEILLSLRLMGTTYAGPLSVASLVVFGNLTFGPPEKLLLGRDRFQKELRVGLIAKLLKALGNLLLELAIKRL